MYLEMLQQRYGSGLEKQSATMLGQGLRAIGSRLAGFGVKLADKGAILADPVLRRMAMEGFKRNNVLYKNILKGLAETMPGRTALLGGGLVGTGLGAGYLANELTRQ